MEDIQQSFCENHQEVAPESLTHTPTHTYTHTRARAHTRGSRLQTSVEKLQICGWNEETRSKICMSSFSRCALNINVAAVTTVVTHSSCRVAMSCRPVFHCAHTRFRGRPSSAVLPIIWVFCCLQADSPTSKRPCDGLMMFSFHHPGARLHLCPLSSFCIRFHHPSHSLSLSIPLSIHLSSSIIFPFFLPSLSNPLLFSPFILISLSSFPASLASQTSASVFLFNSLFLLDVPRPFLPTFN